MQLIFFFTDSHHTIKPLDQQGTPTTPLISSFRPTSLSLSPSTSAATAGATAALPPVRLLPTAGGTNATAAGTNATTAGTNATAGTDATTLTEFQSSATATKPLAPTPQMPVTNLNLETEDPNLPPKESATLALADPPPSLLSGPPNPGGLKTSEELCQFWSPSVSLGHITASRSHSETASYRSGQVENVMELIASVVDFFFSPSGLVELPQVIMDSRFPHFQAPTQILLSAVHCTPLHPSSHLR